MPKLIIKSGSRAGEQWELPIGVSTVGRGAANSIVVLEPSISTCHCELNVAEIGIAVHDLNSTNGTFVNQQRVAKGMPQNGDLLTLGDLDFTVELPEVNIALPEMVSQEPAGAAFLEDGTPACFNHREAAALFRCTRCENWWCGDCVRQLKRLSGDFMNFCPDCSAACAPIPKAVAAIKRSFFQRVGDTLRLPRKK